MSIYSEYLDRITNGDLDARHGGSLTTSFEKVTKSVRDFESKLSVLESNINPLYERYDGGYIPDDAASYLITSLTRIKSVDPLAFGKRHCDIKTARHGGSTISQSLDVASKLRYSYEYINTDPSWYGPLGDDFAWFIDMSNDESRDLEVYIHLYHPNGEICDESFCQLAHGDPVQRIYGISLRSYQSIPRMLFHFYIGGGSSAPLHIDIRPSDEVKYNRYNSIHV